MPQMVLSMFNVFILVSLIHITSAKSSIRHFDERGAEDRVIQSTKRLSSTYFGKRHSTGLPPQHPFLCYTLMTKALELQLLMHNIAAFGERCDWAITASSAHGLEVNLSDLKSFASRHNSTIIRTDLINDPGYLVKTILWKSVVYDYYSLYSHVWFIDADIQFVDRARIESIEKDWLCGSTVGYPPLVSQPTIAADGDDDEKQAYEQVNYYARYKGSGLSAIGTDVVENQVLLADMGFMYWLFKEIVDPYFTKFKEYNVSAWGISRTWCKAAEAYIEMGSRFHSRDGDVLYKRPLACAVLPHPVHHLSTHGLNKTLAFYKIGRTMASKVHSIFPKWNTLYKRLPGYPDTLLSLVDSIKRSHKDSSRSKSLNAARHNDACSGVRTAYGKLGNMWAYAWVETP